MRYHVTPSGSATEPRPPSVAEEGAEDAALGVFSALDVESALSMAQQGLEEEEEGEVYGEDEGVAGEDVADLHVATGAHLRRSGTQVEGRREGPASVLQSFFTLRRG